MTSRRCQTGAAGVLVVAVLVLMMVVILAGYLLTRVDSNRGDRAETMERLAKAAEALDTYAAAAFRLPCPANPALDIGEEVLGASVGTCGFPEGTLPWKSIGMSRDASFDSWARKISYRVYTGNQGSLTQPGGASMVQCDTDDPAPEGLTPPSNSPEGGLCIERASVLERASSPVTFLQNKQLPLTDSGTAQVNVGYVLVSHGATGMGGYTASGTRLDLPTSSDERNNTKAAGAFTIRPFSASDVPATDAQHFDDLLAYRTIPELARRSGLAARDWPEEIVTTFNQAVIEGATGHSITPGQGIGESTLQLPGLSVGVVDMDGTPPEIGFAIVGGVGGIGAMNGLSSHLESGANEFLSFQFGTTATRLAITLNHFGTYGPLASPYFESVVIQYFLEGLPVGTGFALGCNPDGGLASISQDVGMPFDAVVIAPFNSINFVTSTLGNTSFLISEVAICGPTGACATTLATPSNTCTSGFV